MGKAKDLEMLLVGSKTKDAIKGDGKNTLNVSGDALEALNQIVHDLVVRENIVTFDQIYEVVFSTFTDNLTPPYRDLVRIISKFVFAGHVALDVYLLKI